ncbi:diaminopimelate dehydrogenase [Alcaligenes ammonioxydans]|uniref:Meso-diaminopimelate D-dehydrogenase n=1 Tax=Alcaligenes ammonioxydans TaxID=2582914 RepID=A0ABX8SV84_9BURK|nr:diaminopimelate dehydrogenase [Alcaligenes ammonioxydans]QBH18832.1 diaminopimelate dehydrogenase [Alcaligenes faecalis]QXX79941.1 diaminopimelate dehydrogenase [Alcaligenes ammonioxydans]
MSSKIRVGIAGYGNLGRGVELSLAQNPDMELVGVFTRRDPASLQLQSAGVPVRALDQIEHYRNDIDVLILCSGSKNDLPEQGPALARWFTTVDSFDTHARVPEYYAAVDAAAQGAGTTALIAVGWDPGLFSLNRLYGECVLPVGQTYTFWGKGLSQGHSDAIRRVAGVAGGVQYTLPVEAAVQRVRNGEQPELSTREKHKRQCFVVLEQGADADAVREAIVTMPDYFADYDTEVNFIDAQTLARDHAAMPHGGFVIRSGQSAAGSQQVVEYGLKLGSNPEFTSSVLVAYARAAYRMNKNGQIGAQTVLDVPPGLLSPKSPAQLRKELL